MIYEEKVYGLRCDGCAEDYIDEHSGFSWYADQQGVQEAADNDGWHGENGKHYCPNCHHFDDNDNLILKPRPATTPS